MIRLSSDDLRQIKQIAESAYPHECCGVMVGSVVDGVKTVVELVPAENSRTDSPANRYLITADFVNQVEKRFRESGSAIIGFFHRPPRCSGATLRLRPGTCLALVLVFDRLCSKGSGR